MPVKVRNALLDDYAQVAELESRYSLETKTRQEWEHLWVDNPIYRQHSKTWPIGWVLEDSNRNIVGYLGNIPLSYEFAGKKLLVATTRAWVVDSRYRSYGMLLLDYFFDQSDVDLYLTTSLNSQAFQAFGFFAPSRVPTGDWDHSTFWITNYAGFVHSALRKYKVPLPKLLSYPLCVLPFLRDRFAGRHRRKSLKQIDVEFCSGFDERFDVFWEELKRKRPRVLLSTRTREILDWHFGHPLVRNRVWIFCVADGPRLLAYSIYSAQENATTGLKRIRLADFQTIAEDDMYLLPMLSCALERCRSVGIDMLEDMGISPERALLLAKFGPYRRKLPCWSAFYKTNDPDLAESLKDTEHWELSLFDSDATL